MVAAQTGAWRGTGPRTTVKAVIKHGEGQALALRKEETLFPVARGPVPRDLSTAAENARSQETTNGCCADRGMARDRPSHYGESGNQAWRGTGPRPTEKAVIKHGEGQGFPPPYGESGNQAWQGTGFPTALRKGRRFSFPRYGRITVPSLRRTGAQPPLSGCSGNGNFAASSSSISMPSPGASLAQ